MLGRCRVGDPRMLAPIVHGWRQWLSFGSNGRSWQVTGWRHNALFPDVRLRQMLVGLRGVMFWGQKGLAARLSNQLIEVLHGDGGMGAEVDACVFTDDH